MLAVRYRSASCCGEDQMAMNFVLFFCTGFVAFAVTCWLHWIQIASPAVHWYEIGIHLCVVMAVAEYLTLIFLLVFLRLTRQTITVVPSAHRVTYRAESQDDNGPFTIGDIDLPKAPMPVRRRQPRHKSNTRLSRYPTRGSSAQVHPTDKNDSETEAEQEKKLDEQLERIKEVVGSEDIQEPTPTAVLPLTPPPLPSVVPPPLPPPPTSDAVVVDVKNSEQ